MNNAPGAGSAADRLQSVAISACGPCPRARQQRIPPVSETRASAASGMFATGVDAENRSALLDKELQQISIIPAELDYSARAPEAKPLGQSARVGPQDI